MNIGKENENIEFKKTTAEIKEGLQSISSIFNLILDIIAC